MVDDYLLNKVLDKMKEIIQYLMKNLTILRFWLIKMINCQMGLL